MVGFGHVPKVRSLGNVLVCFLRKGLGTCPKLRSLGNVTNSASGRGPSALTTVSAASGFGKYQRTIARSVGVSADATEHDGSGVPCLRMPIDPAGVAGRTSKV